MSLPTDPWEVLKNEGDSLFIENRSDLERKLRPLVQKIPSRLGLKTGEPGERRDYHREGKAIAVFLKGLAMAGLIPGYPLTITKTERPDFLLCFPGERWGVEQTDAGAREDQRNLTELERKAEVARSQGRPTPVLADGQVVEPNSQGEIPSGGTGDIVERECRHIVETVKKKMSRYSKGGEVQKADWHELVIYDNTQMLGQELLEGLCFLKREISDLRGTTAFSFDRITLMTDGLSKGMTLILDLGGDQTILHPELPRSNG